MGEEITIKMGDKKHQKWQRLLLYMQNSPNAVFVIEYDDYEQSTAAMHRLNGAILKRPTWFNLTIIQRKGKLYIIKPDKVKKVVITDG